MSLPCLQLGATRKSWSERTSKEQSIQGILQRLNQKFSQIDKAIVAIGNRYRALPSPYTAEIYRNLERKYALTGATLGLIFGCSQEALRQLKQQQERKGNSDDTKGAKQDRQEANKK